MAKHEEIIRNELENFCENMVTTLQSIFEKAELLLKFQEKLLVNEIV